MSFLILIAIAFLLMWIFLIRPQRRRQQEQLRMQESLRTGTEIVTAGGLYGTVESVEEDEVAIEIADGVVVRVARRAIAGVISSEDEQEAEETAEEEAEREPSEAHRS